MDIFQNRGNSSLQFIIIVTSSMSSYRQVWCPWHFKVRFNNQGKPRGANYLLFCPKTQGIRLTPLSFTRPFSGGPNCEWIWVAPIFWAKAFPVPYLIPLALRNIFNILSYDALLSWDSNSSLSWRRADALFAKP